jgi:hypothetical protein
MIRLTAAIVTVAALTPAAAIAAGVHHDPRLLSQPQMRILDSHHAWLEFVSDRLPRTASGTVDAKVTFANGTRVSALKPVGKHGHDIRYRERVSFTRRLQDNQKFTVTLRLGDARPVRRIVTLHAQGEHSR